MGISNEEKHIKCLYFDLSTEELLETFSNTSKPYAQIKNFLEKQGFEHNQHSGYISKKPLTRAKSYKILEKMAKNFTWLDDYAQRFAITNAPDEMNVQGFLSKNARNEMKRRFKELQDEIEHYKTQKDTLSLDDKQKIEDKIVNLYKNLYKRKFMQAEEYKGFLDSVAKDFQIENDKKIDENTHSKQLTKEQSLIKKLEKEVDYYENKKSVLKPYAKMNSQNTIIELCAYLFQKNVKISNKSYRIFQEILTERRNSKTIVP